MFSRNEWESQNQLHEGVERRRGRIQVEKMFLPKAFAYGMRPVPKAPFDLYITSLNWNDF
jgi:hypothetical protein